MENEQKIKEIRTREIRDTIEEMNNEEFIELWNEFYEEQEQEWYTNCSPIYNMEDFDILCENKSPLEIANLIVGETNRDYPIDPLEDYFFDPKEEYFVCISRHVDSHYDPKKLAGIDIGTVTRYIVEKNTSLGSDKIYALLNDTITNEQINRQLPFYRKNDMRGKCYICFSEEQAERLVNTNPLAAENNVIVADEDAFEQITRAEIREVGSNGIAIVYDANSDLDEVEYRLDTLYEWDVCNEHTCEINLDKMEKRQEQTRILDNGIEM